MIVARKQFPVLSICYDGENYDEIIQYFSEPFGSMSVPIQHFIDGMLRIDTQHGRLTVRKGEFIVRECLDRYSVFTPDNFNECFA